MLLSAYRPRPASKPLLSHAERMGDLNRVETGQSPQLPLRCKKAVGGGMDGGLWDEARWPSFSNHEFACRHCGETYVWPEFLDRLQAVRFELQAPLYILSGHRCALHNAHVGGAPMSQHLALAADISLKGHERKRLFQTCQNAGFTGFGFYQTFLHIDLGRPRQWYGSHIARQQWQTYSILD